MKPVFRKRYDRNNLPPWLTVTTEPRVKQITRANWRKVTNWPRVRINYEYLEAIKVRVAEMPYRRYPVNDDLFVSIMPWSRSGYVDMRFYRNGKSTARGIIVHIHHWREFYAAMHEADKAIDRLRDDGWIESLEEQAANIAEHQKVEAELISGKRGRRVKQPTFTLPTTPGDAVVVGGTFLTRGIMPK